MKKSRKFYKNRRDSNAPYYQETMERDLGHLAASYHARNMLFALEAEDISMDPSRQARFLRSDFQTMGHAFGRHDPCRNLRSHQLSQSPQDPHINTHFRDLGLHQSLHSSSSSAYSQPIVPEHLTHYPTMEEMRLTGASRDGRQLNTVSDPADALLMEQYRFPGPQMAYEPPQYDPGIAEPAFNQENPYVMVNGDRQKKRGGRHGKSKLRADATVFVPNAPAHETKREQKPKEFVWLVVGNN